MAIVLMAVYCFFVVGPGTSALIYEEFGTWGWYVGHAWIVASHNKLWDVMTYPCPIYLLLVPRPSYICHVLGVHALPWRAHVCTFVFVSQRSISPESYEYSYPSILQMFEITISKDFRFTQFVQPCAFEAQIIPVKNMIYKFSTKFKSTPSFNCPNPWKKLKEYLDVLDCYQYISSAFCELI